MGRDMHPAEGGRGRDAQDAANRLAAPGDPGLRFLDAREDRDDPLVKALAGLGQHDLARGALQKTDPETILETPDALRDHGRGKVELPAGRGHSLGGHHPCENVEISEMVHP